MTSRRYKPFYEIREELVTKGKRFDAESLKLISFGNLNLACVRNAGKAACNIELVEDERKRRVSIISGMSFEEVESDKGKWKILDDNVLCIL